MAEPTPRRGKPRGTSGWTVRDYQMMEDLLRQMQALTDKMGQLTTQVSEVVSTVKVTQAEIKNHADRTDALEHRIEGVEGRERAMQNVRNANTFSLGSNLTTWVLMIALVILAAALAGHIAIK